MATSQNGWSANDRSLVRAYRIGDRGVVHLRDGDAGYLLSRVADWFDANIRDLDGATMDDWGYAERPVRGGKELSNHASGTAIDINATEWPLGEDASVFLTKDEIRRLRDYLSTYEGVVRWGQDYASRKDPMHFEIDADADEVGRIADKFRKQDAPREAASVWRRMWNWLRQPRKEVTSTAAQEGLQTADEARRKVMQIQENERIRQGNARVADEGRRSMQRLMDMARDAFQRMRMGNEQNQRILEQMNQRDTRQNIERWNRERTWIHGRVTMESPTINYRPPPPPPNRNC